MVLSGLYYDPIMSPPTPVLPHIHLVTADGSPLRCSGIQQVSVIYLNCSAVHLMSVSPDIKVDAIMGLDVLRIHQLIVDPNDPATVLLPRSAIPSITFNNFKDVNRQVAKWRELLEASDFKVQNRPGKHHRNADAISCPPLPTMKAPNTTIPVLTNHMSETTQGQWAQMQASDPDISLIDDRRLHGSPKSTAREVESSGWEAHRLCLRQQFLHDTHEELVYCGQAKTLAAVRQRYWWPEQQRDVVSLCQTRQTCAQIDDPIIHPRAPRGPMSAGFPNHRIGLGIIGPLFQIRKGDYTADERKTEAVRLQSRLDQQSSLFKKQASKASKAAERRIRAYYEVSLLIAKKIHPFTDADFVMDCIFAAVDVICPEQHGAFKPKMDKRNKTRMAFLRSRVDQLRADSWDDFLPRGLLASHATIHFSTSFTPHTMLFGCDLRLPSDVTLPHATPSTEQPNWNLGRPVDSLQTMTSNMARTKL
ncbi:unnamed protein product [Schistocephalus solidus]|uniref:Integrase_H2C2 domain-containing protein n=1 Tax=Schistocephalus solidus TaxID=70667 RepID=A0A183SZP8_SCHSO|nr:unnamed protein product [Schistocephalus solidus]